LLFFKVNPPFYKSVLYEAFVWNPLKTCPLFNMRVKTALQFALMFYIDEVIGSKTKKEQLKLAINLWHTLMIHWLIYMGNHNQFSKQSIQKANYQIAFRLFNITAPRA